jgi:hypothetical protein
LIFCWLFVTWIGKKTVPTFVDDAEVEGEEEEYDEEEYDNDDGIIGLTAILVLLLTRSTGIERINGLYRELIKTIWRNFFEILIYLIRGNISHWWGRFFLNNYH